MREDICSIPITDIFEVQDGCPLCRLQAILDARVVDYMLGGAMMEPDIREETNKIGFCPKHLNQMMQQKHRLALALLLETHIAELTAEKNSRFAAKLQKVNDGCYMCDKINWGIENLQKTIYKLYETQEEFRQMFDTQPAFCLKHAQQLLDGASKKNMRKQLGRFTDSVCNITKNYLQDLKGDLRTFCNAFDYRSTDKAGLERTKDAIERAALVLAPKA